MHTVVETPTFQSDAKSLRLSAEELKVIIDFLAANPVAGDEISGTGGARKVRFPRNNAGKSGGYRVITFYTGKNIPVFLMGIFAKGEKINLTQAERNELKQILKAVVESYKKTK